MENFIKTVLSNMQASRLYEIPIDSGRVFKLGAIYETSNGYLQIISVNTTGIDIFHCTTWDSKFKEIPTRNFMTNPMLDVDEVISFLNSISKLQYSVLNKELIEHFSSVINYLKDRNIKVN